MEPVESRALAVAALAETWELVDLQFSPLGLQAIAALSLQPGDAVLDIGCGQGQTLAQLAERVGPGGQVIGVDIAPPLLEIARRRTAALPQVRRIAADAQTLDLPSASVDAIFSRFGVMAFEDPITAFGNFHRMLRPSGRLAFVCWRPLSDNELDHLPLAAARMATAANETPFSLADPGHVRRTLADAGFRDIDIRAHDESVSCGDLDATLRVVTRVGALGRILRESPALRAAAEPRVREALAALGDPARVSLRAAVWIASATA